MVRDNRWAMDGSTTAAIDAEIEEEYWRVAHINRPYIDGSLPYDEYQRAYQCGLQTFCRYGAEGRCFEDVEAELESCWNRVRGGSSLTWSRARPAIRDAWERLESALCADTFCPDLEPELHQAC